MRTLPVNPAPAPQQPELLPHGGAEALFAWVARLYTRGTCMGRFLYISSEVRPLRQACQTPLEGIADCGHRNRLCSRHDGWRTRIDWPGR